MSDANPQQEPSMEEILASIRRIISEDDVPAEDQGEAEEASVEEAPAEEASEDVLELTEVAEETEDEPVEEAAAEAEEEPAEEATEEDLSIDEVLEEQDQEDELELLETEEEVQAEPEPEPAPEPESAPAPATVVAQAPEAGLLATEAAAAAAGSLSGLVAAVDRAHGGSILGDGNRTIEDLVKEVMRPMVKDWLDENLPGLTERLVRREIERLARLADED